MTLESCKIGMLVRAVRDLEQGYWATGLLLGKIVGFDEPFVTVKCIAHGRVAHYEGSNLCCDPAHLVLVSKDRGVGLNNNLTTLFDD